MLDSHLAQPLDVLEQVGVDFVVVVGHEVAASCPSRNSVAPQGFDAIG
jgi:hypothetical protein